jgi:hypothetical protein
VVDVVGRLAFDAGLGLGVEDPLLFPDRECGVGLGGAGCCTRGLAATAVLLVEV